MNAKINLFVEKYKLILVLKEDSKMYYYDRKSKTILEVNDNGPATFIKSNQMEMIERLERLKL